MASQYVRIPPTGGSGPGAGVSSFNGRTGSVASQAGDYSAALVSFTPAGDIIATDVQGAIEELDIEKQDYLGDINVDTGGLNQNLTVLPDNESGGFSVNNLSVNVEPQQNSPNLTYQLNQNTVNLDTLNSAFTIGTSGQAVQIHNNFINHQGTSNVGDLVFANNYASIGNGTDPISVGGLSYSYGFANIDSNVTFTGTVQGYGFQINADSGASLNTVNAFYDFATVSGSMNSYNSFIASPTIGQINNNNNYVGFQNGPNITTFDGNSGYTGIGIFPTIGSFDTGNFQGIVINPTITSGTNITGINIYMDNANGTNVKALDVTGDVYINGGLSFTGGLSIGQLQAFYASNPVDGGGNPQNMHGLVTQMIALNGVSTINADAIGVNTAMLIELQEDSVTTSGALGLGFAALALPCVVRTETNSSLDFMNAAVYAINLAGDSTGGTIDVVNLCRTVVIPNGITTINELRAFQFDLPFGDAGTDIYGLHIEPVNAQNYIAGSLNIGSSTKKVSNSDVAFEIGSTKAMLNARLTTAQKNSITPIAGMQVFDTSLNQLSYYNGTSWVNL